MTETSSPGTVHLQYVGDVPGTRADTLIVGDTLMWNGGSRAAVIAIKDVSKCFLVVTERSLDCADKGAEYARRMKKDRLVAVVSADGRSYVTR